MNKRIYLYYIIFSLILINLSSCSDYLEKFPLDQPSDATFWSTQTELEMSINSVYNDLYWTNRGNGFIPFQFLFDCISDIMWDRNQGRPWQILSQGLITPYEETLIYGTWDHSYTAIGKCNQLLAHMDRAKQDTDPEIYGRIEAEARFFRAYHYFWLINLYGDVPFVTEPLDIFDAQLPRTDKSEIYDFILNELDAAADVLPLQYSGDDIGRITKGAALAIKARAALFNGDWDIAAEAAKKIIDSKVYSLYPDYGKIYTYESEGNNEGVLTLQYNREYALTHESPVHIWGRLTGGFVSKVPTQSLIDSYDCIDGLRIDQSPLYDASKPFENRDPRLGETCVLPGSVFRGFQFETHPDSLQVWNYNTVPPTRVNNLEVTNPYATFSGYQFRRYEDELREYSSKCELNIMFVRYAEVLLMYAEAKTEMGQIDQSVYDAIDEVRQRAGMPDVTPGKNQAELRQIIRHERKVEFPFEGLRFFDIRRWKIAEDVMPGILYGRPLREYKSNYIPTFDADGTPHYDAYADELRQFDTRIFDPNRDYLWPVPQKELDINPNLTQNPGY